MATQPPRARTSDLALEVEELCAKLRRDGFDLRRSASVSYLLEAGRRPGDAVRALRSAGSEGWRTSLYADRSGWVVRLTRTGPPSPRLLTSDHRYVEQLAAEHGLALRAVAVEDLDAHDPWQALAARARRPSYR